MAAEIERKFLVTGDGWREEWTRCETMRQGYLVGGQKSSVRIRISDEHAWLNIKSATLGVARQEYEYAIPVEDAREMLDSLCEGPLIEKTRYYVPFDGHTWEVDVFDGDNSGLIVAELELDSADAPFPTPPWIGEEVSHDPRYYNVSLVTHPYRDWQ